MKTTIDLDEAKLERAMKLTGLTMRKEAIDFALTEAERSARVRALLNQGFFEGIGEEPIVDPQYDVLTLRDAEIPPRPGFWSTQRSTSTFCVHGSTHRSASVRPCGGTRP